MIMYFSCNNRGYYIWQKSHQSKLIRFDLKTRDFQTASIRSKVLLSVYLRLKRQLIDYNDIREQLLLERDRCIEHELHMYASNLYWGGPVSVQLAEARLLEKSQSRKISLVAEEWYGDMSTEWRPLTLQSNKAVLKYFIDWNGDTDIESVTKSTVARFKKELEKKYASEMSRQSVFKKVTAFFSFAVDKRDYLSKNPFTGMGYKNAKNLRTKQSVPLELHTQALALAGYKSPLWWLLQLLYYTGMRVTETTQLTKADYVVVTDRGQKINCISVNDSNNKRVKNSSSIRMIPIHKKLIELGILEEKPTSPWKVYNTVSRAVSKIYNSLNEKHTPHDYRYGMSDRLRDLPNLPDHVRFSILGHSNSTITDTVYRGKQPIILMKNAIDLT
ncbi:phage integrase SAM-like domain-containing protein [Serratia oryzae]|uniref:Tyr recombinase domain-containing protein n=1 Tax=Serratia oryzae TaxID=2034155 RepID=A0A1S8CNE2_9GAMM|nr:tyrosine-type recombinase/integrase [Serratia oryzae]OMQ24740.1 hypothetical protein BMI79_07930 [Serratia oryzae]